LGWLACRSGGEALAPPIPETLMSDLSGFPKFIDLNPERTIIR